MQFSSFSEFIAMGNHGLYVWLSYGICFVLLSLLVLMSHKKNKQIIKQIKQRQERELKLKKAAEHYTLQSQKNNSSEEAS